MKKDRKRLRQVEETASHSSAGANSCFVPLPRRSLSSPHELIAAEDQLAEPKKLKPGGFAWHPELAPDGPVVIIVSIPDQLVTVYRNGNRIAA